MAKRIVFTGKQQVAFETFTPGAVGPDAVAVQVDSSLISTGTEGIVFNRLFEPGTHWDAWVKYPFYPGYAAVGRVVEVGAEVESLAVGDTIATLSSHASFHVIPASACHRVPDGVDVKQATWIALGKVAFMGARAGGFGLGDRVLIIGAGPVGQMTVRWANAAGAETIIAVDTVQARLDLARKGGATHLVARSVEDCREEVEAACGGELPPVVVDTTGNAAVFSAALGLARHRGRVVVLGDTGAPSQQHLTSDVIRRGLTIIGAHGSHEDAEWTAHRIYGLFFELVRSGRFDLSGLITHQSVPEDCAKAYEMINTRRHETMGILFDWTQA